MMTKRDLSRGAVWRQWDLHVHTPASFHWSGERFESDLSSAMSKKLVDEMIEAMNKAEPAVFAIMDYWTFDGWFALKQRLSEGDAPKLTKKVFPGIELRLSAPTEKRLNAHVIFSDEIADQHLKDFLSNLKIERIDRSVSKDALVDLARTTAADMLAKKGHKKEIVEIDYADALLAGYKLAEVKTESYKSAIASVPNEFAIGFMPYDTSDGLTEVKWEQHYSYFIGLFESSPIFESRNLELRTAFLCEKTSTNHGWIDNFKHGLKGIPRLVVAGSDAHCFVGAAGNDDKRGYGDFPSGKKTWIKADPTFHGLKQAILEPGKRSFIGDRPPKVQEVESNKTFYIESIEISKTGDIRLLLKQDFNGFNENVQNRKAEIEGALDACSRIKLVVPYTGNGVSQSAIDALQVLLDDDDLDEERLDKQVDYYAAADITRDLLAEQAYPPVNTDIALQKHAKVESPRTTYYGIARLTDLVALHKNKGKALYERNIRYFLGSSRSDVNKAIKATLHDDPGSFFYLNNGVTAVCDEIELKGKNPSSGFRKFKVRGLSIINGAQTVASAAEFVAQHPGSNINDAKVMLTLIKAPADGPFGKRVTKARNHQNPVQTANFASLDENQERLRQEIAHLGFAYHYRPEAAATGPEAISLDEALRVLASRQDDPRYAVWLKSEPARLANPESPEYQALFPTTLTGVALVNAVLCHRAIRTLVVDYEQKAAARSQEKLIYRHAIHVITAVMMKRLRQHIGAAAVIDASTISGLISQPLDQLRQQTSDLGQQRLLGEGPLAYFRNQGSVASFMADLMEAHFALSADPTLPTLRNINTAADGYPRKRVLDYLSNLAPQLQ